MKSKYGQIHKVTDFISRLIPKSVKDDKEEFIGNVLSFLMELDELQYSNQAITLNAHASDGIYVYYNLEEQFFIKPTQNYLLLHFFEDNDLLKAVKAEKVLFDDEHVCDYVYGAWRIRPLEFKWLIEYMKKHFVTINFAESQDLPSRYIDGMVRQAILDEFISGGRICNGVKGKTTKHKVEKGSLIEFDHILPHSEGGTSDFRNVQILCRTCNRIKSNSAR